MTAPTRAYTSTVRTIGPSLWCAAASVAIAVAVLVLSGTPPTAVGVASGGVAVVVAGFVLMSARVSFAVSADEVAYRVGIGAWRRLPTGAVRAAENVRVGSAAIAGAGIAPSTATARHILRAGPALHLELHTREHIWLSTRGPVPGDLMPAPAPPAAFEEADPMNSPRRSTPWFGGKRIGWGIRPQTWQGWLVTALAVAVVVVIGLLGSGRL